jgi:cytochrome c oxidase assembly protein subunit 15
MFSFPMSKWVGNILYEHGHRLIASAVGMLTTILAIWLVRVEPRRWVRRLGIAALAVVIAQGVLGGLTVVLMLPPPISIAHAGLAELFFCITVTLAFVTSDKWTRRSPATEVPQAALVQRFALGSTVTIYIQILLGAAIRHADVGTIAHIFGALMPLGCAVATVFAVLLGAKQERLMRHAVLLLCLVSAQIALGVVTLLIHVPKATDEPLSTMQMLVPTAHLALGALILATSLGMTLKSYRFLCTSTEEIAMPFSERALS